MTINLYEIAQWWDRWGFQIIALSYLAVYFLGVLLLATKPKEEIADEMPKKSCAPYAIFGIILMVTGVLAIFGSLMPWVSFELQTGCAIIAATLLVIVIYWAALS